MADTTRYIDPASTGGDGTTNALSGSTAAYASMSSWDANEAATITTGNRHLAECSNQSSTFDTTVVTIASPWAPADSKGLVIYSADANKGPKTVSTSYTMDISVAGNNTRCIYITNATNAHLLDLQLRIANASSYTGLYGMRANSDNIVFENCHVYGNNGTTQIPNAIGIGSNVGSGENGPYYINCSVAHMGTYGIEGVCTSNANACMYNCSVNNCATGFRTATDDSIAKNCISYNNSVAGFNGNNTSWDGASGTSNHNVTDDTFAPGNNGTTSLGTDPYVDKDNEDLSLASGGGDAGEDLSSDGDGLYSFSTDAYGATRSNWYAGADDTEETAGATETPTPGFLTLTGIAPNQFGRIYEKIPPHGT